MATKLRLGVLGSGSGSNMQSIQDAIEAGTLNAEIAVVITDVPDAGILARAARHNLKGLWIDHAPFKTKLEGKAEVTLKCELIYAEPVFYYVYERTTIGYLQIKNFDDSAAVSLKNAVTALQNAGAQSLIIDVRDNTTGKPGELAEALDYLLPKGELFLLRDRSGKETAYTSGSSCINMPMVVMVNENTSSAAEVFAGVMQQAGIKIVGRRTAANALSQVIVELSDGSAVRISRYEYLNSDKKSMADLGGVSPDIISYQIADSDMDVQLEAALDVVG